MVNPDIVIIQRWMNADAPQAIRDARRAGQVIIQDVDDWFWGLHEGNRAFYTTDPKIDPEHNRQFYKEAVAASDVVTVSTAFLQRRIRERIGTKTVLLRNCVDAATFATQPVRDVSDGLVVGWTGALAWRSGDLETLTPFLPDWLKATGSTFVHHGRFPGDALDAAGRLIGLDPAQIGPSREGCPPLDYPQNVAGFDIGIVPLNDVPFNRAKSGIKGLEYAAAGIPFVAYGTEEYQALGCGITARTPKEWAAALDRLRDPTERAHQQRTGLKVAAQQSFRRRWRDWETTYLKALGEPVSGRDHNNRVDASTLDPTGQGGMNG